MELTANQNFHEMKRKIYLVILPLLLISNILYWLMSPNMNTFMQLSIPPTCVLLVAMWICFYRSFFIRYVELFCVGFTSIYHLIRLHTMMSELAVDHINIYMFWSPIYYIFIFLVLERRKALQLATVMLVIILFMTYPLATTARATDIITQYLLTSAIYTIILFYFNKMIAAYIEADMLAKTAYVDHLTKIGNRRSIDRWLEQQLQQSELTKQPFAIIYFDIDHFKKINDTYGHDIGDHVLKQITTVVKQALQPTDQFGRWGGEEFLIVCTNRSLQETVMLAEVLRQAIEQHSFPHVHHITSSFGVTAYMDGDVQKSIVKRADEALYQAKESGRNAVIATTKQQAIQHVTV